MCRICRRPFTFRPWSRPFQIPHICGICQRACTFTSSPVHAAAVAVPDRAAPAARAHGRFASVSRDVTPEPQPLGSAEECRRRFAIGRRRRGACIGEGLHQNGRANFASGRTSSPFTIAASSCAVCTSMSLPYSQGFGSRRELTVTFRSPMRSIARSCGIGSSLPHAPNAHRRAVVCERCRKSSRSLEHTRAFSRMCA